MPANQTMTRGELLRTQKTRALSSDEQKMLYGEGNPNTVRYALRGDQIVSKEFAPGDTYGDEWKTHPGELGLRETHPQKVSTGLGSVETVVGTVSGLADTESPAKVNLTPSDLAAITRKSKSTIKSGPQTDFGDAP